MLIQLKPEKMQFWVSPNILQVHFLYLIWSKNIFGVCYVALDNIYDYIKFREKILLKIKFLIHGLEFDQSWLYAIMFRYWQFPHISTLFRRLILLKDVCKISEGLVRVYTELNIFWCHSTVEEIQRSHLYEAPHIHAES